MGFVLRSIAVVVQVAATSSAHTVTLATKVNLATADRQQPG
jgi:hypothetical protein